MSAAPDPQPATDHRPEWVGGVATLPRYITEGGKTYRPSLLVWLDAATEMILGVSAVVPEDALAAAASNLRDTAQRPAAGSPMMPGRVRVASQELADALRREPIDGLDVVCAPTPELDQAIDSLLEHMASEDEAPDLQYLGVDATVEGTAAMFRATARLYRAKPWGVVPHDNSLIGVTSERLGLRDAAVSVIGQAGKVHGFVLFASLEDFHQFGDASDRLQRRESPNFPCHLALTYNRRDEVGPGLLAEVTAHRWELAGAAAYPVISAMDQDGVGRGPTQSEMLRMEAIAASLVEIVREYPSELAAAFEGGAGLVLQKKLATSGGELDLEISAPHPGQQADGELLDDDGELDDDRVRAYRSAILERFEASPEAKAEPEAHWAAMLVDYAASYFSKLAESLSSAEFQQLVFDVFPRKVSVEPEAAPAIVAGLRAFLIFLQREFPEGQARRCLAALEGDASQRLARRLADPSNFGPAKSFVMSGRAAGFDMSSEAGFAAWAEHMRKNNLRLPMGRADLAEPRREPSRDERAARQAKKSKRKAQRAARHKSRAR